MVGRNLIPALTNDRQWDSPEAPPFPPPVPSMHDPHDTTLSPLSQSSSGYFSTSVSTATLSDTSAVVSDSAPLDPSPAKLEASGPETTVPRSPQQRADRNGLLASSQYEAKMAIAGSPASQNPSNHSSSLGQRLVNSFQPAPVDEGVFGGRGRDSLERLEIILDDEDGGRDYTLPDWLIEGACVTVGANKGGTVRYLGNTEFAHGVWVGVELDLPSGVFACMRERWKEIYWVYPLCVCIYKWENIHMCVVHFSNSFRRLLCLALIRRYIFLHVSVPPSYLFPLLSR